jgi:hypothetical protein
MSKALREPDIAGSHGKAWKVKVESLQDKTTLNAYLISVYGAHPFWNWWLISAIHLRDVEGMPAAVKEYPTATHEFIILTLDPKCCPPDSDDPQYKYLLPADVLIQFDGLTDTDVAKFCTDAVTAIVDGQMSPDQDYRSAWRQLIEYTVQQSKSNK